jgi:hypothetical protein
MAQTHDLGRLYVTRTANLDRWSSPVQRGWSAEIEEPYRQGRCLVLHLPGTELGLGLGWWGRDGDEAATLERIGVRDLRPEDIEMEEADS